jgi:hypothetical protein
VKIVVGVICPKIVSMGYHAGAKDEWAVVARITHLLGLLGSHSNYFFV